MKLELSDESWDAALPREGAYHAEVVEVRVFGAGKGDRELCELTLRLDTGQRVSELVTIWVDETQHDRTAQLGRAKVLLGQLAKVTHAVKRGLKTAAIKLVRATAAEDGE
jgi:hypothetical protein